MKTLLLSLLLAPLLSNSANATTPLTELNDANFDQTILNSPLAVVDFNQKWCGASQRYRNVLLDFYSANPSVDIYSVDVAKEPQLAADFSIRVYPTTYIYRYGKIVYSFEGVPSEQYLVNQINSHQ